MSLYKRGRTYWMEFWFGGRRYRQSTHVRNERKAQGIEDAFRTQLARGEVGIEKRKAAPTLRAFAQEFLDFIQVRCAEKPRTVKFYAEKMKALLSYEPFREAKLDRIDEALIERFVLWRRQQVGIVTVNRSLACLRRLLRLAQEWKVIDRVPRIRLLSGEPQRDFILSREEELRYLSACPQPLHDIAILLLDTGLRIGEALALRWSDIRLTPVNGSSYGWLAVREGKSRNARRAVPLTERVATMLRGRQQKALPDYVVIRRQERSSIAVATPVHLAMFVFPGDLPNQPLLVTSVAHMHARVCRPIVKGKRQYIFPAGFVIHSLRHSCLTRLGEARADAFTIMKLAGHSSVTISQRYVHPTSESIELAFRRLETLNKAALQGAEGKNHPQNHPRSLPAGA